MYIDSSLAFDPSGTALTATRDSTNVLDMLNNRDMGVGEKQLKLLCQALTTFAGPAGSTVTVSFMGSPDNVNWFTFAQNTYAVTLLTAAARMLEIDLPRGGCYMNDSNPNVTPRYYKLNYAITGGPFTAGTIFAGLVLDRSAKIDYPKNYTVSN